jgi:16S rRNA (guanine527-N7)-methyltransferase
MDPARITELLVPYLRPDVLSPRSISIYIDILLRWNKRINLTAIRNPEEIVTRHFGESIFAARNLFPANQQRAAKEHLADLGSGAGFPGIPIKIWAPGIELTLIESNQKKAAFLREVARGLGLTGIDVQNVRAEAVAPGDFDVVTLRAVERITSALPIAARLLKRSGRLALLITSSQLDLIKSELPDFSWDQPIPIPQSQSRLLLIGTPHRES